MGDPSKEESSNCGNADLSDSDIEGAPLREVVRTRRTYDFEELSGGEQVITILFQGSSYELKRTRSGRLVLHK